MGAKHSALSRRFHELVEQKDCTLDSWRPLLEQLPPRNAADATTSCPGRRNRRRAEHPDIDAASQGYTISLSSDFWASRLNALLVEAEVPLPSCIASNHACPQYPRAIELVVQAISRGECARIGKLHRLNFPVVYPADLAAAARVAEAAASAATPEESEKVILLAESSFPLPPLLSALQTSSSIELGKSFSQLCDIMPNVLAGWVPVTGRPLPSSLLQLPAAKITGDAALRCYKRWAVLNRTTPLFGITPFHTMFHNTFQPQHLFDAAAMLPRADGSPGNLAYAVRAAREPAFPPHPGMQGTDAAERRAYEHSLCYRFLAAAAAPETVPTGAQAPHVAPPPATVLPLLNALDAFGNSALCHATEWALAQLRVAVLTAIGVWSKDAAASAAAGAGSASGALSSSDEGKAAHGPGPGLQCTSRRQAVIGAMWIVWKHSCEPVFRVLLSLGADSTRPQHLPMRQRRDVSGTPIPLLDMLLLGWNLPNVSNLPSTYSRLLDLPVDFSSTVRSKNHVAAQEWRQRQRAQQGAMFDERYQVSEEYIPPDLASGAVQPEVGATNEHLLQPEHEPLLQWLVCDPDGVSGERSVLTYRSTMQMWSGRMPFTVFDSLSALAARVRALRGEDGSTEVQRQAYVTYGRHAYPGCFDMEEYGLSSDNIDAVKPQVGFLLQRLLQLGAVPSIAVGRMLYFYSAVLPSSLGGVLWFRRRHAVLLRARHWANKRSAAAAAIKDYR